MTGTRRRLLCILAGPICLAILLSACDSAAGGSGSAAVVRDSAGIEIVENSGPMLGEGDGWRLSPEPLVQIGMAEGAPADLLDRVAGARRLPDGRIVIANGGSGEVRYYTADGAHLRSVGGQGEGPGEYRGFTVFAGYRGDSLFIYDQFARRASVISREGEFGRVLSFSAIGEGGQPRPMAVFGDGTILGRMTVLVGADEVRTGMQTSQAMYGRFAAADGVLIDSLATVPGEERHLLAEENMLTVTSPLIGPEPHVTVAGDRAFVAHGGTFEVRVYGADGTLQRLIRRSAEPVPLSTSELDRLLAERLGDTEIEDVRRRLTNIYSLMPTPEVRPAFSGLMADDVGNLWVREAGLPWEPDRWSVFDAEGRELGPIEFPAGLRPMHIGDDFVLGVVSDELDVQRVRMYGIDKDP